MWQWSVGSWVGWHLGTLVYASLGCARRFRDLARRVEGIDLFDLAPLTPFARQGVRIALLFTVLLSIFTTDAVDRAFASVVIGVGVFALAVSAPALLLPLRVIRARIHDAKREELARIYAALRDEPDALADSPLAARTARLDGSDLLAYRSFVASVSEWPFDAPVVQRFALLALLPVGSWLGGARVERFLEILLG